MEQITLDIPNDAAIKFKSLSVDEKNALVYYVTNFLNEKKQSYKEKEREKLKLKLLKTMREMSEEAVRNGMTPEILNEILNER